MQIISPRTLGKFAENLLHRFLNSVSGEEGGRSRTRGCCSVVKKREKGRGRRGEEGGERKETIYKMGGIWHEEEEGKMRRETASGMRGGGTREASGRGGRGGRAGRGGGGGGMVAMKADSG